MTRGLSEQEARELSAQLNRRGIAVSTEAQDAGKTFALHVSPGSVAAAWETLCPRRGSRADSEIKRAASSPLIPTRASEREARERELGSQLSAAIERLPTVQTADVIVSLPDAQPHLNDLREPAQAAAPRAVASITRASHATPVDRDALRALIAAAVPGLRVDAVQVIETTSAQSADEGPACAPLATVGPVTLTRESLPLLKLWVGTSLVLHMLGSLGLLLLLRERRNWRTSQASTSARR